MGPPLDNSAIPPLLPKHPYGSFLRRNQHALKSPHFLTGAFCRGSLWTPITPDWMGRTWPNFGGTLERFSTLLGPSCGALNPSQVLPNNDNAITAKTARVEITTPCKWHILPLLQLDPSSCKLSESNLAGYGKLLAANTREGAAAPHSEPHCSDDLHTSTPPPP